MEKKVDRRIRRTQKVIRENFIELLLEKPIKEIRVQTLTDRADINRGTFYQHYEDIYDLLNSLEDEIISEFTAVLEEATSQANHQLIIQRDTLEPILLMLLDKILSYVKENEKLMTALFKEDQDTKIKQKLRNYLYDFLQKGLKNSQKIESAKFEYYYSYVTSGCTEVITRWIRNGSKEDTTKLARLLEQFILNGTSAILE